MPDAARVARFRQIALPHLDAAYNLARWLVRNDHDAEDIVQDACVKALRFSEGFRGGDGRAWLLTIVRNTALTWLRHHRAADLTPFDDEVHGADASASVESLDPAAIALQRDERRQINRALESLPIDYREVIVLREIEDLSYREIAAIAGIPIGTVMSRLARGRRLLAQRLLQTSGNSHDGLQKSA